MLILSPLEQFQILSLITIKIFGFDFSITNALLVNILALLCFSDTIYFFSSNDNCLNKSSFFFIPNLWQVILKKITSLPEIDIKTFFNNLITISSFLITPPKSLGKISILSWWVNQYEESKFILCCILAGVFMLVIALLGFLFIYIIYKKDTFFVNEVLPFFKKLSPMRKLILGSFTVFTAIPNKFWVNVKIHFIFVFILSAIIYLLGLIFPFLFFCYVMYLILCFESLIFGLLYEYSEHFRKVTNFLLFGNSDEPFAPNYFHWFWGNMWNQGTKKATAILSGAAAAEAKRQLENKEKNDYADKHTAEASAATKEGFKNPHERAEYHKERRDEWVQENGTVTKIMKTVENWWSS